ncbi:hypothetical protein BX600DRAFT_227173 [Xylariales sp. PMI_506]|nr:hypothetical protein BX600DRAFT_227173 [Xylariales sp. PMI_506]
MGFGLAILGYGLASLSEGLTAYDWWLVVALAWLALITNISVLFGLGDFFRFNPTKRTWRLCLVVLMFTTLAFCLVPVGRMRQVILHDKENSLNILSSNVLCFFPGHGRDLSVEISGQVVLSWSVVLGLLIAIAVVSVAVMLLERPHGIMVKWCEHYRGEMREYLSGDHLSCARCEQRFILLVIRPFIAFWLTLRTYLDLMNSLIFQVCRQSLNYVCGELSQPTNFMFRLLAPVFHPSGSVCAI